MAQVTNLLGSEVNLGSATNVGLLVNLLGTFG